MIGRVLWALFSGPNDRLSSARVFLALWLGYFPWCGVDHLTAWQAVAVGLLSWAGGQHVAQMFGKTAGEMAKATGDAVSAAIAKRRTVGQHDGTEPTP